MPSVLVIGGGIAGVEAALTLARTLNDADVTVVSEHSRLCLLPNLVYVPFGVQPRATMVDLRELLAPEGIDVIHDTCAVIDLDGVRAQVGSSWRSCDALVVAPGVEPFHTGNYRLRTIDDAIMLQQRLAQLSREARSSIAVRVLPSRTWSAPAYEFTLLLATWLRASGTARHTDLVLVTSEQTPMNTFGYTASDLLGRRLADADVEVLAGIPPGRVEDIEADIVIDFVGMAAHRVHGLPPLTPDGFYHTPASGAVAPGVFVVGDATALPFKAGFTAAWQVRQVAAALGGDLARLGSRVDGVPTECCEYQMDLGEATLHVRFDAHSHFTGSRVDSRAQVWVSEDHPDKLRGTLLRTLLPADKSHAHPEARLELCKLG